MIPNTNILDTRFTNVFSKRSFNLNMHIALNEIFNARHKMYAIGDKDEVA